MRILAVILGTFVALFGLAFGGCAVAVAIVELWHGVPNPGLITVIVVSFFVGVMLLRAAYVLLRGPSRPRNTDENVSDP